MLSDPELADALAQSFLAAVEPTVTADTATIGPDATGTFTFKLRAPLVSQTTSFTERFDLLAESLYWFNYWENPGISGFYVPITSICC